MVITTDEEKKQIIGETKSKTKFGSDSGLVLMIKRLEYERRERVYYPQKINSSSSRRRERRERIIKQEKQN